MMTDDRDLYRTVDGHRLRVRWFAPRTRPTQPVIVMLHQGLGSVSQWRDFPEKLAAETGFAVVGYDRWGHGGSDRLSVPRSPRFLDEEAERSLPELLDSLGLEKVIAYGHSDGGSIALLFAASHPCRVLAVISEAAHVFSEAGSASGFAAVIADFETGGLRERLARHHGDNVETMFRGWADIWRSPAMQQWRMTAKLPAVRCPVFVLQGDADDHGSFAQVEAIVAGVGGPVESWMIPGCGHSPHLEAPAEVAQRCRDFLVRAARLKNA